MNNIKAVYFKQMTSQLRNPQLLIMAAMFIGMALFLTFLADTEEDCDNCIPAYVCEYHLEQRASRNVPNPSVIGMFSVMFAGLALVSTSSALVLEDKTTQNLRFMTMAGVKPIQYLIATCASLYSYVILIVPLFAVVGGYFGREFFIFVSVVYAGALVSVLLGVAMGLSKYPMISTPIAFFLGFGPMLANMNEGLSSALGITYTLQMSMGLSDDLTWELRTNFLVMGVTAVLVLIFFAWMYRKGELEW